VLLLAATALYLIMLLVPRAASRLVERLMVIAIVAAALAEGFLLAALPAGATLALADGALLVGKTTIALEMLLLLLAAALVRSVSRALDGPAIFLLLLNLAAIPFLLTSRDWLVTIVALELLNLSLYLLAKLPGLGYFLISALATTFFLGGIVMLYTATGTTHYESIEMLGASSLLILLAILLKLGAAPFHSWAPDLYAALPLPLALWFSLIPKLAMLGLLLVVAFHSFALPAAAATSLAVGAVGLCGAWQIGRFIAYSSIVHLGYFLLAYSGLREAAFGLYLGVYGLSVLLFLLAVLPIRGELAAIAALRSNRALGGIFAAAILSLAGVPPLAGFFAKLSVLADVQALAVLAVLASTVAAANYLTVLRDFLFGRAHASGIVLGAGLSHLLALIAIVIIFAAFVLAAADTKIKITIDFFVDFL